MSNVGVKLASADKSGGQLLSITLQLLDPAEIKIFRSLLASERNYCPECKDPYTGTDTYYIKVDAPLAPPALGMNLATPMVKCDSCGRVTELSMIDYTPFKSALSFVQNLRKEYNKRQQKG